MAAEILGMNEIASVHSEELRGLRKKSWHLLDGQRNKDSVGAEMRMLERVGSRKRWC